MKLFPLLFISLPFVSETRAASQQGSMIFESSLGMLNGSSTELVYRNSGSKLSQLDWEIDGVPIINLGSTWGVSDNWTLAAHFWSVLTTDGDAHM